MTDPTDKDLERTRLALKSGRFDPNAQHQPQQVRSRPTEGEVMQFGDAAAAVEAATATEDLAILPDHGQPVPKHPRGRGKA